jgi:hypothetical protein
MRIVSDRDFIVHFEDLLPTAVCREIVERFESSSATRTGRVFHVDDGDTRSDDKLSLDLPIPEAGEWADLHRTIHEAVSRAVGEILPRYPSLQIDPLGGTGYKIQKYARGEGHFTWHVDGFGPMAEHRLLALVLYLNDVERGGETEFHHQDVAIRPRTGDALLFPTAWTHMHRGRIPESNDKYVISSFFEFVRAD